LLARTFSSVTLQFVILEEFQPRTFPCIPSPIIIPTPQKWFLRSATFYKSKAALPPRAEMVFGTASAVSIDSIVVTEDGCADYVGYVFVYGKVTYTDELGTEGWTEFCHRYPCEMMEGDSRIRRKYARYHEIAGNNAG
jgi:hypothetical protein